MKLDRRQKILLGLLGGVLLLAIATHDSGGGGNEGIQQRSRRPARRSSRAPSAPAKEVTEVVEIDFAALDSTGWNIELGRDPWRFATRPAPPPTPIPVRPREPSPEPPPREPVDLGPRGPVLPSMDHLEYIGSFGTETDRIATFRIANQEIHLARVGDIVDESFVLVDIGYESVDVGYVDFPDEPSERLGIGQ